MFVLAQFNYKYHYEISINDASNMKHQMLPSCILVCVCLFFFFLFLKTLSSPNTCVCIHPQSDHSKYNPCYHRK